MEQPTLLSLSSSFTCDWTYDVFLSFRGTDTRNNFTGNLYNSLQHQRGIQTFIDDEEIQKGEQIKATLLQAIKESRIFIAIISPNYASSTFCLTELVTILECCKSQGRLFLPVFYDVNPSQIRNITDTYAEAFAKHEVRFGDEKEKVQKWRDALHQAANMSGWHFKPGSESEYKFIEKIVEEVSIKINRIPLHVANKPVGLESRVLEVTSLLGLESDESVNMVGIYGIGGIGKSTTARAVHNLIADQFEGVCYLADIRERSTNHDLAQLQETLLSEILGEKDIKVGDVHKGISIIKRRLQRKKVLLILDNVNKEKQLQVLAGGHDWFGFGSKIIITTRDKHLLATHGIVKLYEVKQLEDEKALDLFSWHAFENNFFDPGYVDIAKHAVSYCHGLPLALEVIGSQLFGKSLSVWKSSLDKYERVIRKDIHEILKVSYDDLEENEKGIFLDLACFFNSYEICYVKEILYLHGFHVEDGIQELTDKCLMKIDVNGRVRMHDLIQDMGREIVRQESTLEPGRRSRLWFSDDIVHVLEENKGTDTIEVIIACLRKGRKVKWCGNAFGKMKNLRILIIRNAQFSIGPQIFPNSLRVLDWSGYESSSLPSGFNAKNLIILNLPESRLRCFESLKVFEKLNFLDFEGCKFLTEIPSLSRLPNLGALCLDYCTSLIRIHDSVGFLDRLVLLSAQGCTQLESLVPSINLPSLETLDLRGCSCLVSFPEVVGVMENIKDLYLDQTALEQLPFTIGNMVGLQRLFLRGCQGMIRLPSYILPKFEIITSYGCRGFQSSEDKENVSPKVFANAICVYNDYGQSYLNLFARYITSNNIIEICSPRCESEFLAFDPSSGRMSWDKLICNKSSLRFWFRKKFPIIALSCNVEPEKHLDNMVLDFKLTVVINGTKHLTSSCIYIFYTQKTTDQMLCCDLQCKADGVFSENGWNHVEILCEMEHLMPCDSTRSVAYQYWTTKNILKGSFIYVYSDNKEDDYSLISNPDFPLSTEQKFQEDYFLLMKQVLIESGTRRDAVPDLVPRETKA
ncbi:disease resistance protein Roq1-like isoform X1 [Trifolium pratense]|uniref:disease resistance protein Roq1-like isoform X1 n=1 Tax=Trifolium pratense TaxID=57577 RepID=UPI001E6959C1|nr:disease resistance protein Roq1-like isoform X1 [Trifolium pratense]